MTQNVPELGKLIDGIAYRDAVHIAVAPVIAVQRISPGSNVSLYGRDEKTGYWRVVSAKHDDSVGVIDPYLDAPVEIGQCCYLFLLPNTIVSLRHVWSHPAFVTGLPDIHPAAVRMAEEALRTTYDSGADLRNVK